jgi:hypothetical protein
MGTEKESFIELTERIGRKTGGVSVYPFSSAKRGADTPVSYIMVRTHTALTATAAAAALLVFRSQPQGIATSMYASPIA